MVFNNKFISTAALLFCLAACGGGGGSSAATPAPPGGGGGTPPPIPDSPDGIVSGGVGVVTDPNATAVGIGVGQDGTGAWMGDVQAFSSVILNDETTNTDSANFTVEGVPGSQADLKQGQQVLVVGDTSTNTANQVHYRSNVKGPVTTVTIIDLELGTATLIVLGQTIHIDGTTTFSNLDLANLLINDLLEVSGPIDANGDIQASFVELKTSLAEYKVIGIASNLTATTFDLGTLTIDFSSATLNNFSSGTISDGDAVEAKGTPSDFTAPGSLTATEVENLATLTIGGDAVLSVEGVIDRFVSSTDFDVQSTPITTDANTVFVNGDANSLAINVKVQIEGTGDGNGTILASKIIIQSTNTIRAEGNIEAIDVVNNTVTVLSTTFVLRDLTCLEDNTSANVDPLALADLGIGDEIRIRGYLDATTVVAIRLRREDPRDRARLRGPVTAEDTAGGTVSILSVQVTGQTGITTYEDLADNPITQIEFHNQVEINNFVKATWDVFVDTTQIADELSIED